MMLRKTIEAKGTPVRHGRRISTYLSQRLFNALKAEAIRNGISISAQIEATLLECWLDRKTENEKQISLTKPEN